MRLLKQLCETPAVPGREQQLIDLMQKELKKTCDTVSVDSLGNVIGIRKCGKKNAKKIMICGHMDEIGFVVSHIDDNGFLHISPRGGHHQRTLIGQRVRLCGKKDIIGIVEGTPVALIKEKKNEAPEVKDMFVDTGFSAKDVKKNISIGDFVVLDRSFLQQGDVYISKAMDDRVGCYMVVEAMKRLKDQKLPVDVYAVGSTQEEVGLRGAHGASKGIDPDIGIALDVSSAMDVPGVGEAQSVTKLGSGVGIKINDVASISNHGIVKHLTSLAKKHKIKHQKEILPYGGTDAKAMQMFGAGAVCTLSIPTRYVHSPSEMINKNDLKAGIDLLVHFLKTADKCTLEF